MVSHNIVVISLRKNGLDGQTVWWVAVWQESVVHAVCYFALTSAGANTA